METEKDFLELEIKFKKIRKDFPILTTKIKTKKLIYADNSATTQKPKQVIDEICNYYKKYNSNIFRSGHYLARIAEDKYEQSRKNIASFIGAEKNEIIFTSGATQSFNFLGWALLESIKEDDEILLSENEHHSNLIIWQEIIKIKKAKIKIIPLNENFEITVENTIKSITKKTKIISLIHVSNVSGNITNVEEIGKHIRKINPKIIYIIDATQSVAHKKIDVKKIDCNYLVFSSHKIYGPMGVGILYGKYEDLKKLKPVNFGGGMINEVEFYKSTYSNQIPTKFEAGTPNISAVIGFSKAISYIQEIGIEEIEKYENCLANYLYENLKKIQDIKIYSSKKPTIPIISFTIKNIHSHDITTILDQQAIAVRGGHHCVMPFHTKQKISSTTRISLCFYNTKEEIDKIIQALKKLPKIYKKGKFLLD